MLKIKNNVGGSGGKDIIAFALQTLSYSSTEIFYAENGMTWGEFVNSKYNINGAFSVVSNWITYNNYGLSVRDSSVIVSKNIYRYDSSIGAPS